MEGVQILNKIEVTEFGVCNILLLIAFIFFTVISIALMIIVDEIYLTIIFGVLTVVFTIACGVSMAISFDSSGKHYRYECLIDESISLNDLYEKYEIVEQRGEIWVLEEKEVKEND